MSTNAQKLKRLDRNAVNSEERGTFYHERSVENPDDLNQLKAMIMSYRTHISAELTGLKVAALPRRTRRAPAKKKKK